MSTSIERARELVPTIILTVLSMIQALALELFWSAASAADFLWQGGWDALIGWLQVMIVLGGILLIWIMYVSYLLRFSWLPSLEDTLMPFLVGLLEFAMISTMHPDLTGLWLILLAVIFVISVYSGYLISVGARNDAANYYFFKDVPPTTLRTYKETCLTVATLLACGLYLINFENRSVTLFALLVAVAALVYQFRLARDFWMHSLLEPAMQNENVEEVRDAGL